MKTTADLMIESTLKERARLLAGDMEEISAEELSEKLAALGYKIDEEDSFSYYNASNEIHYYAKACHIVCIKSGKSFANIDSCRKNLPELQELRRSLFVFKNYRIWEI